MSERRHRRKSAKPDNPTITGGVMRARAFDVLVGAVEDGIAYGWRRGFKHDSEPAPEDGPRAEHVKSEIERAVLNAICERFDFPETSSEAEH